MSAMPVGLGSQTGGPGGRGGLWRESPSIAAYTSNNRNNDMEDSSNIAEENNDAPDDTSRVHGNVSGGDAGPGTGGAPWSGGELVWTALFYGTLGVALIGAALVGGAVVLLAVPAVTLYMTARLCVNIFRALVGSRCITTEYTLLLMQCPLTCRRCSISGTQDEHTYTHVHTHLDRQTDRKPARQPDGQTDRQTDRHAHTHTHTHAHTSDRIPL